MTFLCRFPFHVLTVPRSVRFVPEGGALVEVTVWTEQSRMLLRPSHVLNEVVLGVLGRAQRLYEVGCCGVVFMSNHWHALLRVEDALQLSRFMQYCNANLAREVDRLVDWPNGIWSRRYQAILVSDEEEAQVGRLKYLLSHGVKEHLVGRVTDWPGVHSGKAILEGKPLKGLWFSRTQEYAARNRGEDFGRLKYSTEEELKLSPLPCWADCKPEEYKRRVAGLAEAIEAEARAERECRGLEPLGVAAILRQSPHMRPNRTKKSPAPLFHTVAKEVRETFWVSYSTFVAAFREAAERLKGGDRLARFPIGSFPPGLPFVRAHPA